MRMTTSKNTTTVSKPGRAPEHTNKPNTYYTMQAKCNTSSIQAFHYASKVFHRAPITATTGLPNNPSPDG
eukprot:CAMPEP_0119301628 /NCGR_PEP_ID=MMETSP1333-20130426/3375_1 /TAXON_ID=418940 /ORGANISM="Scyphosphaera apsteinii, Strain RCC1455" /LENGTH=69 /DNA_ID=CAMNT_0007303751 /DNA_START=66 /DNA_END=275 /DNA_ORIENTATION=+